MASISSKTQQQQHNVTAYTRSVWAEPLRDESAMRRMNSLLGKLTPEKAHILIPQIFQLLRRLHAQCGRTGLSTFLLGTHKKCSKSPVRQFISSPLFDRNLLNEIGAFVFTKRRNPLEQCLHPEDALDACVGLLVSKATYELHYQQLYSSMFAELMRLCNEVPPESILRRVIRRALLDHTQHAYHKAMRAIEMEYKHDPGLDAIQQFLTAQVDEPHREMRRRSFATVRWVGELFSQALIDVRITTTCADTLSTKALGRYQEHLVHALSGTNSAAAMTVGTAASSIPVEEDKQKEEAKAHFQFDQRELEAAEAFITFVQHTGPQMERVALPVLQKQLVLLEWMHKQPILPSRLRFLAQDVVELHQRRWEPRVKKPTPKTLAEIHAEFQRDQRAAAAQGRRARAREWDRRGLRYTRAPGRGRGLGSKGPQ